MGSGPPGDPGRAPSPLSDAARPCPAALTCTLGLLQVRKGPGKGGEATGASERSGVSMGWREGRGQVRKSACCELLLLLLCLSSGLQESFSTAPLVGACRRTKVCISLVTSSATAAGVAGAAGRRARSSALSCFHYQPGFSVSRSGSKGVLRFILIVITRTQRARGGGDRLA